MIFPYGERVRHSRDSRGSPHGRRMYCTDACEDALFYPPHGLYYACDGACGHGHLLTYCAQHKCKFTQLNKFEQIYIQSEHNMLSVIR